MWAGPYQDITDLWFFKTQNMILVDGIMFVGRRANQSSLDVIKPENRVALLQWALNQNHIKFHTVYTFVMKQSFEYSFYSESRIDLA